MTSAEEIYEQALHCLKNGDKITAKSKLEKVCLLDFNHSRAFGVRASLLAADGQHFDAMLNYNLAIASDPQAKYFNNLATSLFELDQWATGEKALREAVVRDPRNAQIWNNLGRTLLVTGNLEHAREAFCKALECDFNYVDAHLGLAFLSLEQSDFEGGWSEYEWREKKLPFRPLAPKWTGQKLSDNEAVHLICEQGLGDTIQFCRYAPLIKQQFGGRVYLETRSGAYRLLKSLDGIDGVFGYGEKLPDDVKYSSLLLSCPLIFRHFSEDQFPRSPSYLKAEPGRAAMFAEYLKVFRSDVPKVGICWAGNAAMPSTDRRRSTNLEMWEPLVKAGEIGWVPLQKGKPADQLRTTHIGMTAVDVIGDCEDLADTAALIANLDLVISVDTAVAHLAAALGKPTWVLSRRDACWRWLGDRRDSPWYPTVRHYRQRQWGDWPGLMAEVAVDLRNWLAERVDN